jgi:ribosomal protein L29
MYKPEEVSINEVLMVALKWNQAIFDDEERKCEESLRIFLSEHTKAECNKAETHGRQSAIEEYKETLHQLKAQVEAKESARITELTDELRQLRQELMAERAEKNTFISTLENEVLEVHRKLAHAELSATQGWQRYEAANKERIQSSMDRMATQGRCKECGPSCLPNACQYSTYLNGMFVRLHRKTFKASLKTQTTIVQSFYALCKWVQDSIGYDRSASGSGHMTIHFIQSQLEISKDVVDDSASARGWNFTRTVSLGNRVVGYVNLEKNEWAK